MSGTMTKTGALIEDVNGLSRMAAGMVHGAQAPGIIPLPLPAPREHIEVRTATMDDVKFIDGLQKLHTHMVGWMPTKQIEGKISAGHVLVAEEAVGGEGSGLPTADCQPPTRLGYCISQDQYKGRDDVGIIYQLNVQPTKQRGLIGANLIKAVFERAAYGCRLFCCWCAQDIQANYFWESIGFIPLAFRTGSRGKQRIHIFWQRRIRKDDATTPYWFPATTGAGAIREDRLVLPIPQGIHWRDAMPVVLPKVDAPESDQPKALPDLRPANPKIRVEREMAVVRSRSKHLRGLLPGKAAVMTGGGLRYVSRGDHAPEMEAPRAKRPSTPKQKNDPRHVAMARELRDLRLEQVNSDPTALPLTHARYEVSRESDHPALGGSGMRLLPAA